MIIKIIAGIIIFYALAFAYGWILGKCIDEGAEQLD